jgi:hypothetical protein
LPDGANDGAVSTMDVERKRADWPHWPDRTNGPARRDRLERRLFRDSEREAEVERAELAIQQIGLAAVAKAADGDASSPGERIVFDGSERAVAKLGPSPLPGDDRRCAYLEPA